MQRNEYILSHQLLCYTYVVSISAKTCSKWQNWKYKTLIKVISLITLWSLKQGQRWQRKAITISKDFSKISYLVLCLQRVLVFSQQCVVHDLVCVHKVIQSCEPLLLKANLFKIPLALLHNPLGHVVFSVVLLNNSSLVN